MDGGGFRTFVDMTFSTFCPNLSLKGVDCLTIPDVGKIIFFFRCIHTVTHQVVFRCSSNNLLHNNKKKAGQHYSVGENSSYE